ncbi:TetR/AcrR family transcriptional regulator [Nocardioides humilatus]|uniref:TetR/AcrR family transcriptional regulator n=1 Tax=Nocardioides humilatus TaxID=2607660 RepID=A0A5B1LN57_9ACTN|nr:TetR/AcrR family transcriptional regulator [Nocardioides humilatus]KAA1421926.1 TetR/AcrR family transcriptional regulator [Nocardioides humilatus]
MSESAAIAVAPGRRRVRLPPDERRELIVQSATRLFRQRPYSEVSTVDIAREAGIARGLLNHYFTDKRGLYLEVVRRLVLLPELEDIPGAVAGTQREQVDAAVRWFLDSVEPQAASYLTILGSEGVATDDDVAAILDEADDLAARRVLQLVGLDEGNELSRAMVRCYGGLAKSAVREWSRRGTMTREQAHSMLRDVLLFMTAEVLT